MLKKEYPFVLIIGMTIIWSLMIVAKFSQYDTNYVYFALALLISFLITAFIIGVWLYKPEIYKKCEIFTYSFIITSSPISLILFINLYVEVVGQYFKS